MTARGSLFRKYVVYFVARRDHTLEILAVLHQVVGLNKSAADIRATPFVQVVP